MENIEKALSNVSIEPPASAKRKRLAQGGRPSLKRISYRRPHRSSNRYIDRPSKIDSHVKRMRSTIRVSVTYKPITGTIDDDETGQQMYAEIKKRVNGHVDALREYITSSVLSGRMLDAVIHKNTTIPGKFVSKIESTPTGTVGTYIREHTSDVPVANDETVVSVDDVISGNYTCAQNGQILYDAFTRTRIYIIDGERVCLPRMNLYLALRETGLGAFITDMGNKNKLTILPSSNKPKTIKNKRRRDRSGRKKK